LNEYHVSAEKYEELVRIYNQKDLKEKQKNSFQLLKQLNEDYAAWLTVEGTEIAYPVVSGEDNDFYLNHNFHQEYDKVGAIFMDFRNSTDHLDFHTIIYGHNMKDGSMFGTLSHVLDSGFSKGNMITLDFGHENYKWEIFSAYVTRETGWMEIDFESTENQLLFMQDLKRKSNVNFEKEVNENNQTLTLATCTSRVSDERVVIHARLIEED